MSTSETSITNVTAKPRFRAMRLREPFSAGSHLAGALAGIFGAVYLIQCSNGSCGSVAIVLIYSLASIALFLTSGLLHGLHCSEETANKLERLDYAAIYFFIAGTYTPTCLFAMSGKSLGIELLIAEWVLAFIGIWLALTRGPSSRNMQVVIYLAMGWGFLLALPSLLQSLSPLAFNLLITGGIFYSVGSVIFAMDWPRVFKTPLSAHDVWHLFVLLGCASHYAFLVQVIS